MTSSLDELIAWVRSLGYRVTSSVRRTGTSGDGHREGRAIDVGMRGVPSTEGDALIQAARGRGLIVLDERQQPAGRAYRFWAGPHLHIEIPEGTGGQSEQFAATSAALPGAMPQRDPNAKISPQLQKFIIFAAALILIFMAISKLAK